MTSANAAPLMPAVERGNSSRPETTSAGGKLTADAPLAPLVWFKSGGAAQYLFEPVGVADLQSFRRALDPGTPVMVLGLGSNLIVRDGGVPGVVVRLGKAFAGVAQQGECVLACGGGASGILVSSAARDAGIAGLEFLRSIPGTVGGFVRMNGGAYGSEVKDILVDCDVVLADGALITVAAADLHYSYRHSQLSQGAIVVAARFRGRAGQPAAIQAEMDRISASREASQPLRSKTGGSTFKNPDGAKAWQLIDQAGCRGMTVGGAQVSEKHTNFLINTGAATSAELEALGNEVRARVKVHAHAARRSAACGMGRDGEACRGAPRQGRGCGPPLQKILEEDPQAMGALDALEKQAERDKDYATVAEVIEKRASIAPDDATRLQLLQKLGAVYSERLRDAQGAMRTWKRVLELSPGHQKALRVLRESYVALSDFAGLTELYTSQKDFEGLVEVLSAAADKAQDQEQKVALSFRAADVLEQNLHQPERAFRSYERVLAVRPSDERAARKLVPIYESEEKWARLPALYEILLGHAETLEEKTALRSKLVTVHGEKLGDKAAALAFARKVYELDPARANALSDYEARARASADYGGFVEAVLARANDPEIGAPEKRALYIKIAQVSAEELAKTDDAIAIYKRLIEEDPNEEEAMVLLDGLLRAQDKRDDLRWLFRLRTERAKTAQKLEILAEWAVLEEEVLGSTDSAIAIYREMLKLVPHHGPALRALARLLRAAGDAEGAAEILEKDRDLREGTDRIGREIELARLYMTSLKKPGDALAAVKRVFEVSPNEPDATAVTEELLNLADTRARAAVILEATYARVGNFARQAQVLSVLIATAASKKDRLDLQMRLADVHEKLNAHAQAFDVLLHAAEEFAGELPLWDKLSVLASRTHRTQEFVEALARAVPPGAQTDLPPSVEMDLAERAATIFEDGLGDIDRALPYWERIFTHDPQSERAFLHLKQILTTRERWTDLESLYERACAATDDVPRKSELLHEAAIVAEEIVGDRGRAITYYERILALEPDHDQASFALDKLYEQTDRFENLAQLLAKRLANLSGEQAVSLKVRLGTLHFSKLNQPREALGYLEEVLVADAQNRAAQAIVERCLDVPALRARAAQVLEGVYAERGESRELVRVLEIRLEFAADAIEKRELLRRVAELRDEKLSDDPSAFDAYARLLPLAPQDNAARERLLEISKRLGRGEQAAEVLTVTAEAASTPQPRAEILADVAKLYETMGDNARAEIVYKRVLELDPEDASLALPAARALERVYTLAGKNRELADVFRIQVKLEENVDERRKILGRLGELCETTLGEPDRAIEAWKLRLEDDPGDEEALAALDRLYERVGNHRALVETMRARERAAQTPEARRALMVRIAVTLAEKIKDTDEAILAYRAVLDDFGADLGLLRALGSLYEAASRYGDLAETLESELSLIDNPADKLAIYARLGDVKRTRLGDTQGGLDAFRQALTIDSSHVASREALERILDDEECRREAASILRPLYEAESLDLPLLRVIDIEVEHAESVDERLQLLAQAATVCEAQLQDPKRAFAYAAKDFASPRMVRSWARGSSERSGSPS